jgi:hypothetical protein
MGAPVRLEDAAFGDARIETLGQIAGYNRYEALGRMAHLWRWCTDRATYVVSEAVVRGCLGPQGVEALLESDLGERVEGGIRVRGTVGRVEWLDVKRKAGKAGGEVSASLKASKKQADSKHPSSRRQAPAKQTSSKAQANANPLTLTLSPTLSLSPDSDLAQPPAAQVQAAPLVLEPCSPDPPAEPTDGHKFRLVFEAAFLKATGGKATWSAKASTQVKALVDQHGLAEVVTRAEVMFSDGVPWPPGRDIATFCQHFDKFVKPARLAGTVGHHRVTGKEDFVTDLDVKL